MFYEGQCHKHNRFFVRYFRYLTFGREQHLLTKLVIEDDLLESSRQVKTIILSIDFGQRFINNLITSL